jgi:hypothetical protein
MCFNFTSPKGVVREMRAGERNTSKEGGRDSGSDSEKLEKIMLCVMKIMKLKNVNRG